MHHKSRSYDMWFLKYKMQRTKFFVILCHFLPFDPPDIITTQKIKILKKYKNAWRYYHFTLVYHKWQSYDVSSDIPEISSAMFLKYQVRHRFFCHFGLFLPFSHTPLTTQKIQILKKWKTPGNIIILHMSTINENHMMHDSWDMECNKMFSHLGLFFALLPPKQPQK